MKIGIVGSRNYPDENFVANYIKKIAKKYGPETIIVSGEAKQGADYWAHVYAVKYGMQFHPCPPQCDKNATRQEYIRAAFARNTDIVINSDIIVAFHNEISETHGTFDTIYKAVVKYYKPVYIYDMNTQLWGPDLDEIRKYMKLTRTYKGPIP